MNKKMRNFKTEAENEEISSVSILGEVQDISQKLDFLIASMGAEKFIRTEPSQTTKLYNINQMARFLGVSPGTLYNKISKKAIPFTKVGGSIRFTEAHLKELLKNSLN